MKFFNRFIFSLVPLFFSVLFAGEPIVNTTKITLQLPSKHQLEFAGFYMAKKRGFYKDVGLNLKFKEYKPSVSMSRDVENEKTTFAIAYSSVVLDIIKGRKIKLLGSIYKYSPSVLLTLKSSGLNNISDFKGKKISIGTDAFKSVSILGMLHTKNIGLSNIDIVDSNADIRDLINSKVDILFSYMSNIVYANDKSNEGYNTFNPVNYGFDLYSNFLITSSKLARRNPLLIKRFIDASLKGWKYACSHTNETVDTIFEQYNSLKESRDDLSYEYGALKRKYIKQKNDFFKINFDKLREIYDLYKLMGYTTTSKFDLKNIVFNMNLGTKLSEMEKSYLEEKNVFKVCVNSDSAPMAFVDKKGRLDGISIDILKIIGGKLGIRYDFIKNTDEIESKLFLMENRCDLIASAVRLSANKTYSYFTEPYMKYDLAIITQNKKPLVNNFKSISNKRVSIKKESDLKKILTKRYPALNIQEVNSYKDALKDVIDGKSYFTLMALPVLSYFKTSYDYESLQIAGNSKIKEEFCMAVKDNNDILLSIINKTLKTIPKNTINIVVDKWVNQKVLKKTNYFLVWLILSVFAIFILFYIYKIYRQKILEKYNKKLQEINNKLILTTKRLKQKSKEIREINITLEERVKQEVEKNREKDKQLLQQSRLAQMGEMISMIAHQWRQPLSAISASSMAIVTKAKLNKLDKDIAIELSTKISQYSQHLSKTIDDFRDFFKSNKQKQDLTYTQLVEDVLNIVETSIVNKNIKIIKELKDETVFNSYANELKQVLLNIIKNAEDVLLEKEIKNPEIIIRSKNGVLEVEDNAGGVPDEIMQKIFDPYFSTKTKRDGTGLGLYMSKVIIEEHCGGKLNVRNSQKGAIFKIRLD